MTRYTVFLFQEAYPEQIKINRFKKEDGSIFIECYLLNEDKTPHTLLFDGGGFKNDKEVDKLVEELLKCKV